MIRWVTMCRTWTAANLSSAKGASEERTDRRTDPDGHRRTRTGVKLAGAGGEPFNSIRGVRVGDGSDIVREPRL